mgnify:CR=1 FL=1
MKIFDGFNLICSGGVSSEAVHEAERSLGMVFPDDFTRYLMEYGALESNSNELFGLGIVGYRNIVVSTMREREISVDYPDKMCVIYNLGIDHILILLGENGCIYEKTYTGMKKIYDTFEQWMREEFFEYE